MQDLINSIAAKAGIDPALAEKAVGMILGYLQRAGEDGPVAEMIKQIPGGVEAVAQFSGAETAEPQGGGGGLLGSLMGAASSIMGGGSSGGIMAMGQQLMSEGLDTDQIQTIATETLDYARQHAGDETVDKVVGSVPGLSTFL